MKFATKIFWTVLLLSALTLAEYSLVPLGGGVYYSPETIHRGTPGITEVAIATDEGIHIFYMEIKNDRPVMRAVSMSTDGGPPKPISSSHKLGKWHNVAKGSPLYKLWLEVTP